MKHFKIVYFFFLLFFLTIFCSGTIDSQDGFQYLAVARNIYYNHEPTAPSPDEYNLKHENIPLSTYLGKDGKYYSPTGIGYSLALLPSVIISDYFYKFYHVSAPNHFPLENDWLILLLASFTNAVFGALLGLVMYLYFLELKIRPKLALILSIITILGTNLFVYTRDSLAHMMFISFLMLTFLLFKYYFKTKRRSMLLTAGLSFGIVMISYNLTFTLVIPVLIAYYFLLNGRFKLDLNYTGHILRDLLSFIIGTLPFLVILLWYENVTQHAIFHSSEIYGQLSGTAASSLKVPVGVFLEGLYGQLFSPGRSIFIFSPLLLIPIFFWHKIRRNIFPELFVYILLSIIYITFYATQYSYRPDLGYTGYWHGEL